MEEWAFHSSSTKAKQCKFSNLGSGHQSFLHWAPAIQWSKLIALGDEGGSGEFAFVWRGKLFESSLCSTYLNMQLETGGLSTPHSLYPCHLILETGGR